MTAAAELVHAGTANPSFVNGIFHGFWLIVIVKSLLVLIVFLSAPMVVGILASALSGWLAITVLLRLVVRHSYGIFAVYRVLLGVGILLIIAARARA